MPVENLHVGVVIEHTYRGWRIVGRKAPASGYASREGEIIFEEAEPSIERVVEVAHMLGEDVERMVRDQLRALAEYRVEEVETARQKADENAAITHASLTKMTQAAVEARIDSARFPPLPESEHLDIPF